MSENLETLNKFVQILTEYHYVDKPYSASKYAFVSPFDTLRKTIFKCLSSGLDKEETIKLTLDHVIVDIERSRNFNLNKSDIEKIQNDILPFVEYIYNLSIRRGKSLAKVVEITNYLRDFIYVEVKKNKISRLEQKRS